MAPGTLSHRRGCQLDLLRGWSPRPALLLQRTEGQAMKKVRITVSQNFNAIGVRMLLGEIGVTQPILQEEKDGIHTITTMMTDDLISRFRNSKGAAHRLEILPEAASK